jgi:hypothetical protein
VIPIAGAFVAATATLKSASVFLLELALPLLLILGVAALLDTIAVVARLFSRHGFGSRRSALALPPGSVGPSSRSC